MGSCATASDTVFIQAITIYKEADTDGDSKINYAEAVEYYMNKRKTTLQIAKDRGTVLVTLSDLNKDSGTDLEELCTSLTLGKVKYLIL